MLKLLLETGPLLAFLMTFKYSNIFSATIIMILTTLLCLGASYLIDRKISLPLLLSGGTLMLLGGLTLLTGDARYIKMKPTAAYLIFASILSFGLLIKKNFVKSVFSDIFDMEEEHWRTITKRFIAFFLILAITNEVIWRNFSEEFWVNFKVFGSLPMSALFMVIQIPFLKKHNKKDALKQ